jgi:NADH-quinone oxidoreductase subunit N
MQPFGGLSHQWGQVIVFVAVASMLLGSFAGLAQTNVKRLLAYSSIANAGYALVGLAAGGAAGVQALLLYLAIYFLNTLGAFGVLLCLRRQGVMCEDMKDFAGLKRSNPLLAFAMLVFMFSLTGVPPMAGFFGKYFIFLAAVSAHMVPVAVIGVLTSVVAAFYYLRIVKLMYFDEPTAPIDRISDTGLKTVVAIASVAMLLFVFWPAPVVDGALIAARSIAGG